MKDQVSISVPYSYIALRSAATMLSELAEDIKMTEYMEALAEPKKVLTEADALADLNGEPRPDNPSVNQDTLPISNPSRVEGTINSDMILDANGLPWDARIHSSAKSFNADGTWKYLRGVDREVLVPQVEAELRGGGSATWGAVDSDSNAQSNTPIGVIVAGTTPLTEPEIGGAVFSGSPVPPPPAPPVAPSVEVTTFAQLITAITSKGIAEDAVKSALTSVGVNSLPLLGARPDLIPTVAGKLGL